MEKQNQYTTQANTAALIKIGMSPSDSKGFQVFELLNFIPEEIWFKKTFIDWKKPTRFRPRINSFMGSWGYDLERVGKEQETDQGQYNLQLVEVLAEMLLYIDEYKIPAPKKVVPAK